MFFFSAYFIYYMIGIAFLCFDITHAESYDPWYWTMERNGCSIWLERIRFNLIIENEDEFSLLMDTLISL